MDRDVLGHSNNQRNLGLDGLFNGLCCLIPRHVNSRCIRLCSFLGLHIPNQSDHNPTSPRQASTYHSHRRENRQPQMLPFNARLDTTNNLSAPFQRLLNISSSLPSCRKIRIRRTQTDKVESHP